MGLGLTKWIESWEAICFCFGFCSSFVVGGGGGGVGGGDALTGRAHGEGCGW